MLNVSCGVSGSVKIEIKGKQQCKINNIWTDKGLAELNAGPTKHISWPRTLHVGTGQRPDPHSAVVSMANHLLSKEVNFTGEYGVNDDGVICTVTRQASVELPPRGVSWQIGEIGLGMARNAPASDLVTYTLARDDNGNAVPFSVDADAIVVITYTLQMQYPMHIPPTQINAQGLPPTTAEFFLLNKGTGRYYFARDHIGQFGGFAISDYNAHLQAYETDNPADTYRRTKGTRIDGEGFLWGLGELNGDTEFFGVKPGAYSGATHIWKLSPPIRKNNRQELMLAVNWEFKNVQPTGV